MAEDVLKLPGSSYDTVVKVIKAYAEVGDKTSLATISKIMGTDPTVASRNIAFLMSVGLLEGGRDKGPTPQGIKLGRALQFNEDDDVASAWREVLTPHPLTQRVLAAIRVRGGMDATTLQSQIVYTAGGNKSAGAMRGGGAVLEMLKASGLIIDREGKFIAASPVELASSTTNDDADDEQIERLAPPVAVQRVVEQRYEAGGVAVNINIEIHVDAKVEDLAALGDGIETLLRKLAPKATDPDEDYVASLR